VAVVVKLGVDGGWSSIDIPFRLGLTRLLS
jgi:hypothetical protein